MSKRRKGRRARGTGSVFWNEARQSWVARKTVNGSKVERWGKTQREAIDKLAEALPPDPDTVTVTGWAARWMDALTVRASTRSNYRVSVEQHIGPALGDVRLADLNAGDVEQFVAKLVAVVGTGTAGKIVRHLRTCLAAAVRAGLVTSNPAAVARKPRHDPAPIEVYTPAELRAVVAASQRYADGGAFNYPQVLNVFFRHWLWRPPGAAAPGVRRRHQPGFPAGNDPLAPASATCG